MIMRFLFVICLFLTCRISAQTPLIPLPQEVVWKKGSFDLRSCKGIVLRHPAFKKEAQWITYLRITDKDVPNPIKIKYLAGTNPEAYTLIVSADSVVLTAGDASGIFYGLQTLRQLTGKDSTVPACIIKDEPAFAWRGYMVDVGRNYQSMDQLKQQIDVMARYKYNIFHLHLTEDVAWRLASKQYPQLTSPATMTRQQGKFYTEEDLKELITYCRERHITLIPEIDMPGHSAAFTRAMKTGMQSDTGLVIVKNILTEFCRTYDVPYIHIGGDEVKITNQNFLPAVIAHIHQLGKRTIGWEPGGNLGDSTIRQLWMNEGPVDPKLTYIDSRHLYLNHMDPLESVTTIFYRRIADCKGGILCLWHDRKVAKEEDLLTMNPVYPAMLAFAERSWRGGGKDEWITNPEEPITDFAAFEKRLLVHQQRYFSWMPFPYVKQSDITWNLYGPYSNNGDLTTSFAPEEKGFNTAPVQKVTGGTVILRHWWAPKVKGVLNGPQENTTWYATTKIYSKTARTGKFWIGFNNLSRSPATDSPPNGTWDSKHSAVWVNGKPVAPPQWQHAGAKGNLESPLVDEGYEYRTPTLIPLKKGWNTILVKAPVGSFQGSNWANPVKWMFTVVQAPEE